MKLKFKKSWIFPAVMLVAAIVYPLIHSDQYILQILVMTVLYAFWSSAYNIIGGYAGQLGLGNGLYIGLGAYIAGVMIQQWAISPWLGMVLAIIAVSIVSVALGAITFPLSGSYYGLASVALLNIMRLIFAENMVILGIPFGGSPGLRLTYTGESFANIQFVGKQGYYWIALGMLVVALIICAYIRASRTGYYLRAIGANQSAAASLGVPVVRYKMVAQIASSALLAWGGAFYVSFMLFIDPATMFSFSMGFNILLMATVGGRSTVFGPLLGAAILYPVNEVLRLLFATTLPGLPAALYGLVLMLVMQFMPQGLIPFIKQLYVKRKVRKIVAEQKAAAAAAAAEAQKEGV